MFVVELIEAVQFFPLSFQVMETKNMLYLVSEFAPNGEIFGKCQILGIYPLPVCAFAVKHS